MNVKWIKQWNEQNKTQYIIPQTHFFSLNNPHTNMPTRWIEMDKWDNGKTDFRTIHWNELVFDIDEKDWKKVHKVGYMIIDMLLSYQIPFYIYLTGGKGIHIKCYLNARGKENDTDWQPIRQYIYNLITNNISNINIDTRKVSWDDYSMGSLIRAEGGIKWHVPQKLEDFRWKGKKVPCYKSIIDEIPEEKVYIHSHKQVKMPSKFKQWQVSKSILSEIEDKLNESNLVLNNFNNGIRPCIKEKLKDLANGINLSHNERVMIVTELFSKRWTQDAIKSLFRTSHDYNANTTNYQVNHIISVPYKPFSCEKIKDHNLCTSDCSFKNYV